MVPNLMEIPGLLGKGIHSLPQELDLHIVSASVMVLPCMERLMHIRHKMHEILQLLLPLVWVDRRIRQRLSKAFDLSDHTLSLWTVPVRFIVRFTAVWGEPLG